MNKAKHEHGRLSALAGRLSRVQRLLNARLAKAIGIHGLQRSDFDVLVALRNAGPEHSLSPGQLCAELLFSSGGMTPVLNRLTGAGLVSRTDSADDGRVRRVLLTDLGSYVTESLLRSLQTLEKQLLSDISTTELNQLEKQLDRLLDSWHQ